jgi:hypothetical protein
MVRVGGIAPPSPLSPVPTALRKMKGARWKLGSGENAAMRYPFALCDCRVITVLVRHIKKENPSTYFAKQRLNKLKKRFRDLAYLFLFLSN